MTPTADAFSAPIYHDEPDAQDEATSSAAAQDDSGEVVDLNDPALLLQELTGYDLNADPYATPPPLPDGYYRVKLKQIDVKDDQGQPARFAKKREMDYSKGVPGGIPLKTPSGEPKMYVTTAIEARVIDPGGKFDNIPVFDRFMDSRTARNGGVPMLNLLRILNQKIPSPLNGKTLVESVLKALAGEPECDIQTNWEGQPSQDDSRLIKEKGGKAPRIKGMHRFPEVGGHRVPDMEVNVDKVGKVNVHAQATIIGYFPAGSKTKKTGK